MSVEQMLLSIKKDLIEIADRLEDLDDEDLNGIVMNGIAAEIRLRAEKVDHAIFALQKGDKYSLKEYVEQREAKNNSA